METSLFIQKQIDTTLVDSALQKGRITVNPDGQVKIVHNLANSVNLVLQLQVQSMNLSVVEPTK